MHFLRAALAAAALALAAGACKSDTPTFCTESAPPAVTVTALDSVTGAMINAGTSLIIRDGAFVDSVVGAPGPLQTIAAGVERPGRYQVTVRRPGYAVWRRENVRVTADRCHVRTVHFDARLQPAP